MYKELIAALQQTNNENNGLLLDFLSSLIKNGDITEEEAVLIAKKGKKKGGPGSGGAREGAGRPEGSTSQLSQADKDKFEAYFGHAAHLIGADEGKNPQNIDPIEAMAITTYTAQYFSSTNIGLRNGNPTEEDIVLSKTVDSALANCKEKYSGEAYRGIRTPREYDGKTDEYVASTFKVGSEFSDKAFTSATVDKSVAEGYSGNQWKTGEHIVMSMHSHSGVDISGYSMISGEKEVLFRPGTRFKVHGVSYNENNKTHYIQMKEVTDKKLSPANKLYMQALTESDEEHKAAINSTGAKA